MLGKKKKKKKKNLVGPKYLTIFLVNNLCNNTNLFSFFYKIVFLLLFFLAESHSSREEKSSETGMAKRNRKTHTHTYICPCIFLGLWCRIWDIPTALSSVEKWNDYHSHCMKSCESMHVVHCTGHQAKFSLLLPLCLASNHPSVSYPFVLWFRIANLKQVKSLY